MSQLRGADGSAVTDVRVDDRPASTQAPETATGEGGDAGPDRRRTALTVAAVTGVIAVPIVIATVAVRTPHWYPLVDMAQIEMRVRDVGTSHPPLVGPIGRFFGLDTQGAHPGPISFWLLAPVYRLLGSTAWGLQVSAATLNVAALAVTVWGGHRRWGLRGGLLVAAGLALAMRMYGTAILVYPWNPYTCVLFWTLFLVCVWGVLCGDLALLPVAVVAGTVCAQTHMAYVGLVAGVGIPVVVALVVLYRRARGDAAARRRLVRWTVASAALAALLWAPVFVEELGGDPGNISIVVDSFRHPVDQSVGPATAWRLLTEHLDVVRLLAGDRIEEGPYPSAVTGAAVVLAWAVAAAVALRRRVRTLVELHVVVAAALVVGFASISRILGVPWFYLTLWAYGTAALTLIAIVATVADVVQGMIASRRDRTRFDRFAWVPMATLGAAVLVPTVLIARSAPATEDADARVSRQLGHVVQPTVDAIEDGTVPGGEDATLLMTWDDVNNLGGQGFGLMLELERRGYDARAPENMRLSVRDHRVVRPADADAQIHLAAGVPSIEEARAHAGAREIAYFDPRTDRQIERYDRLRVAVVARLEEDGLDDLVPLVDDNLFLLGNDDRLPEDLVRPVYIMGSLPQPVGVFTWEPSS